MLAPGWRQQKEAPHKAARRTAGIISPVTSGNAPWRWPRRRLRRREIAPSVD
jgi:hypothetical protein